MERLEIESASSDASSKIPASWPVDLRQDQQSPALPANASDANTQSSSGKAALMNTGSGTSASASQQSPKMGKHRLLEAVIEPGMQAHIQVGFPGLGLTRAPWTKDKLAGRRTCTGGYVGCQNLQHVDSWVGWDFVWIHQQFCLYLQCSRTEVSMDALPCSSSSLSQGATASSSRGSPSREVGYHVASLCCMEESADDRALPRLHSCGV